MVDLTLRPMTDQEFGAYRDRSAEHYAADKVAAGEWPADGARQRGLDSLRELLPDGLDTHEMWLFVAELPGDPAAEAVGRVWFGHDRQHQPGVGWVWDIEVAPGYRGRGLGRALLAAAERAACAAGYVSLGLNVFGPNRVARALYESSGYAVTSQQMRKALG